jgi:serine/threonine protein kinase
MLTGPMSLLGTPHFMAPEQYEDPRKVDARSDVYSLAATLYCAITGELPFKADTPLEVLGKQSVNDLIPPRQLVPSISESLEQVILTAMDPDPARRPESVLEFVRRLRHPGSAVSAPLAPAPSGAERRSTVRYRRVLGTACKKKSCLHEDDQDGLPWPAVVQDISQGGVGLVIGRRFEPGTVLVLELQPPGTSTARGVEARVTYVRAQPFGHWQVGCAFTEALTEDELHALL